MPLNNVAQIQHLKLMSNSISKVVYLYSVYNFLVLRTSRFNREEWEAKMPKKTVKGTKNETDKWVDN